MNVSRIILCKVFIFTLLGLVSAQSSASVVTDKTSRNICPDRYVSTSVDNICQKENADQNLVYSESLALPCARGFERIPGLDVCIAGGSLLDIADENVLLSIKDNSYCPSGFIREKNSTICIAGDLLLAKRNAKLVRFSERQQALLAVNEDGRGILPVSNGCPAGYLRPPGFGCVEKTLVYSNRESLADLGINPEHTACPLNYFRLDNNAFCIPVQHLPLPRINVAEGNVELCTNYGKGERGGWHLSIAGCPRGTTEIWSEIPVYDTDGLFVKEFVPARFCVPNNLEPQG